MNYIQRTHRAQGNSSNRHTRHMHTEYDICGFRYSISTSEHIHHTHKDCDFYRSKMNATTASQQKFGV